ncbi:MAG: hypothetical protein KDD48_08765 [Bdellovibrionales bacterium]|nr:hypothetical protein [Bdellovibrionales bacterium]
MSEALEITKTKVGDYLFIFLSGMITEDSQLEQIDTDGESTAIIDLSKITRINSYGIRQWINNLKRLNEKTSQIVFTRCPPAIVEQFNMISNFGAGGFVYSFFLPFYSEKLEKDALVILEINDDVRQMNHEDIIEKSLQSLTDADDYVFNDIEDEYFSFLQFQKDSSIDADLINAIKQNCK